MNREERGDETASRFSDQSSENLKSDQDSTEIWTEAELSKVESAVEIDTEQITQEDDIEALNNIIIELDPGHGGAQPGAANAVHGILEKDINLKIAQYLKEELELYDGVTVYMTRDDDTDVELEARVMKAVDDNADVIISLHNNASGPIAVYDHGCTVLTPRGAYREKLSITSQELGCCILSALSETGLENQGLMFRICQNATTYPNGDLCDYYSIIRNSVKSGIPGIIVEHAFLDNESDYKYYLADDSKLRKLAQADAKGIAAYYGLRNRMTGQVPEKPHNYEEKIMLITSDDYNDNEYLTKTYFTD